MNTSKYRKQNLIQKLYNREISGQFIRGVSPHHEPTKQLFSTVPDGLIFNLRETLPNIGNHIFMGATRCGQFLLTYTFMIDPTIYSPPVHYRYRLHFWAFRPGQAAAKVAEVQLFDFGDILEVLTLGIVQWPNVHDRLLVFGYCNGPASLDGWGMEFADGTTDAYITVTTMPSLSGCADCRAVAASFDEEEMAANWDSGVGLTCVRHGLTIHTSFTVPYPYHFDPSLSACIDNKVVLNTGSFVHVLEFTTEEARSYSSSANLGSPASSPVSSHSSTGCSEKPNILNVPLDNRLSYPFLRDRYYTEFLSDTWAGNIMQLLIEQRLQQGHVVVDELPQVLKIAVHKYLEYSMNCQALRQAKILSKINAEEQQICQQQNANNITQTERFQEHSKNSQNHINQRVMYSPSAKTVLGKRSLDDAEKVYDFKESDDKCEPKFKLYRRRCLADKMYEFRSDEEFMDMENMRPPQRRRASAHLPVFVPKFFKSAASSYPPALLVTPPSHPNRRDPQRTETVLWWDCHSDSETEEEIDGGRMSQTVRAILAEWEVEEEENTNNGGAEKGKESGGGCLGRRRRRPPRRAPPRGRVYLTRREPKPSSPKTKRQPFDMTEAMRKEMKRGFGHQPVDSCSVRFTRRFIEIDQEITSTITHIEDDEIGPGFQCALPLSVHGSAYSQMEMISNHKAEKLNVWCAVVTQNTLDIEHFCQKAAERICKMEGFKFWFCSDYDTEIISVCPVTDDILFVIFIKLNAEITGLSPSPQDRKMKADLRNFYETRCLFIWSPRRGRCYLEGYSGLSRVKEGKGKQACSECVVWEEDEMAALARWNPACKEAQALRPGIDNHFGLRTKPVRALLHENRDGHLAMPLSLILDYDNLIGFKRL